MATKNFVRALHDAKALGRFEGMAALIEVGIVAIHNICTEHEMDGKWERILISEFEAEITRIIQVKEGMCAEDIGDMVVGHDERLREASGKE